MVFVKGQSGNPAGKPKGIKNAETIAREERRAIFDAEASKMWLETIRKLPPTYIADQFMGKAPDLVDVTTNGDSINPLTPDLLVIAEEELKKRKANGT